MISDARVIVTCDLCEYDEEVELTALAHHESYDMRNVRTGYLRRAGWEFGDGDSAICPECVEQRDADAEEAQA